jgi:hypothetical protein
MFGCPKTTESEFDRTHRPRCLKVKNMNRPQSPYAYIRAIFRADSAKTGGIVRRRVEDVHEKASLSALQEEVKARGFHLLESGEQYIVICNAGEFKVHC